MSSGLTSRKRFNLFNKEANSLIPLALYLQQKVFSIIWPKNPTHTRVQWGRINVSVMASVQSSQDQGHSRSASSWAITVKMCWYQSSVQERRKCKDFYFVLVTIFSFEVKYRYFFIHNMHVLEQLEPMNNSPKIAWIKRIKWRLSLSHSGTYRTELELCSNLLYFAWILPDFNT